MGAQTYDLTQQGELFTTLHDLHLPMNTFFMGRTASNNMTATINCAHHGDVQKWGKALGEEVHVSDGEATCVGELASMPCLVTTRAA